LPLSFLGFLAIGVVTGAVSGMFGIGGGIFVIPAMVYLYGFDQKMATGTSLGMLLPPIGIAAFWQYYKATCERAGRTPAGRGFRGRFLLRRGVYDRVAATPREAGLRGTDDRDGVIYILTAR